MFNFDDTQEIEPVTLYDVEIDNNSGFQISIEDDKIIIFSYKYVGRETYIVSQKLDCEHAEKLISVIGKIMMDIKGL